MSTETASVPFKFVLVKARVNARKIDRLADAGIRIVDRSDDRAKQIQDGHVAKRGRRHYLRLGDRMNAAGQIMGDSGWLRIEFNKDGDIEKAITVADVLENLADVGYNLADIHVMRRTGDQNGMGFLVLVLKADDEECVLTDTARALVSEFMGGFYRSCFVYENKDDSATVNANTAVVGSDLARATDRRHLRFRFDADVERTHWESAKRRPASAETRA